MGTPIREMMMGRSGLTYGRIEQLFVDAANLVRPTKYGLSETTEYRLKELRKHMQALERDVNNSAAHSDFACDFFYVTDRKDIPMLMCEHALRLDVHNGDAYQFVHFLVHVLGAVCPCGDTRAQHFCMPDGSRLTLHEVGRRALQSCDEDLREDLVCDMRERLRDENGSWSHMDHVDLWTFGDPDEMGVNQLFGTLLLGLNRLETTCAISVAHASMIEYMLEGYKRGDVRMDDDPD
jgi:hypothetical protein